MLLATILLAAAGVQAPSARCGDAEWLKRSLQEQHGETQLNGGFVDSRTPGELLVVFANQETGTWTVLQIWPDGLACFIAAGTGWMDLAPTGPEGSAL